MFGFFKSNLRMCQAEAALEEQEVPVGCVVVDPATRTVVSRGRNATNATKNVRRFSE